MVEAYKLITKQQGGQSKPALQFGLATSFLQQDAGDDGNELPSGAINATHGILMRRDGTPVECKICGANHYPMKCPDRKKKGKDNDADNKDEYKDDETAPDPEVTGV